MSSGVMWEIPGSHQQIIGSHFLQQNTGHEIRMRSEGADMQSEIA